MAIYYLLSGPNKTTGLKGEIVSYLQRDLLGKKRLITIASTPDDFEKNDKYFYGDNLEILGAVKMFKILNTSLEDFKLIDSRVQKEEAVKLIKEADIIYLMPGNPITQIEYLNSNGFNGLIKSSNGIVLGVSAGSMNIAKTSYYSKDEDYPKTFMYEGLGLIDITIDPHFNVNDKTQVQEAINESIKHEIIGLPNESSIIISDDVIYIGDYYQINNGKIIEHKSNENNNTLGSKKLNYLYTKIL